MRLLIHDKNTTFPITIHMKNSSNWADIKTKCYGEVLKTWRFEEGRYVTYKQKEGKQNETK